MKGKLNLYFRTEIVERFIVLNACRSSFLRIKWLREPFEYGRFPLAAYIAWSFSQTDSYKFWLNGKLVARKALEF